MGGYTLSVAEETGKETRISEGTTNPLATKSKFWAWTVYLYNIVGKPSSITLYEILGSDGSAFEDSDLES